MSEIYDVLKALDERITKQGKHSHELLGYVKDMVSKLREHDILSPTKVGSFQRR